MVQHRIRTVAFMVARVFSHGQIFAQLRRGDLQVHEVKLQRIKHLFDALDTDKLMHIQLRSNVVALVRQIPSLLVERSIGIRHQMHPLLQKLLRPL